MTHMENNHHYQTTDTALATWLYIQDVPLLEIYVDYKGRGVFTFDSPSTELIQQYVSNQAIANIRQYHETYRMLVDRYHAIKRAGKLPQGKIQ